MSAPDPSTFHKPHRKPQAGRSFDKKHSRDLTRKQATTAKKSPHAFSVQSTKRAARSQRRNLDLATRRQHLPIHTHVATDVSTNTTQAAAAAVETSTVDPPPFLVTVIGPRGTGKSSIIASLVKHYTGHSIPLSHLRGPITLLTASNRRITLIEAQPTLSSIIDLSKTADLVLLTVDASFGFEMETFETLNALKQHGLPKVMGVLTHLDAFRTTKQVNTIKRKMKHRFWTEICDGAKLFYLSGMINNKYLKREVSNLARFISVMKYRPLEFRSTHPYVLCDRMEDLTAPGLMERNPLCDRRIAVYGYVRGTLLHPRQQLHVMGVGDYVATSFQLLDDPCACKRRRDANNGSSGGRRKKLNEKEKRMYAPMSDVGEVMYDEDAMYIDMKAKHVHYTTEDHIIRQEGEETAAEREVRERKERERPGGLESLNDESVAMVRAMQRVREAVDEKLRGSEIQLFKGGDMLTEQEVKEAEQDEQQQEGEGEDEGEDEDEEMARLRAEEAKEQTPQERMTSRVVMHNGRVRRKVVWNDDEDEDNNTTHTINGAANHMDDDEEEEEGAVDGEVDGVDDEGEAGDEDDYYRDNFEETRQRLREAGVNQLTINGQKYVGKRVEETKEADVEDESMDEDAVEERDDDDEEAEEEAIDVNEDEVNEDDDNESEAEHHTTLQSLSLDEQKQHSADDGHISTAWKDDIIRRATATHQRTTNLMQLVYGTHNTTNLSTATSQQNNKPNKRTNKLQLLADDDDDDEDNSNSNNIAQSDDDEGDGDELFSVRRGDDGERGVDSVILSLRVDEKKQGDKSEWTEDDEYESIRNRFVTGNWSEEVKGVEDDDERRRDSDEEEEDKRRKRKDRKGRRGKGQDAETSGGGAAAAHTTDSAGSSAGEDETDHGISVEDDTTPALTNETDEQAAERRRLTKEQQKAAFNASYDKPNNTNNTAADDKDDTTHLDTLNAQAATQATLDSTAFTGVDAHTRVLLEGARPGQYIRIELSNLPCEFVTHFSPTNPLVIGGLLPHECGVGWLQCRVKKHRWHRRVLKSNDMLIISNGWRRYQTLPVYAMEDRSGRLRYLKYTPEHMHCTAVMYGPLAAVNSGFLAYQYEGGNISNFRIAITGTIIAQSKGKEKEYAIVKKLKLIGHPFKIFKNTAFIKDMFTSSTEIAKFINASVRTVSGIRGSIKAAVTTSGHDGMFRATFEDRIVASDIVVCRSWSTVEVHAFYAPVQNLLVSGVWRGLRTMREVREAEQKWAEQKADSAYGRTIERRDKKFSALHVPKALAKQLPFAAKEKVMPARAANRPLYEEARLVVRSKEEKELYTFMQHVNTVKGVRDAKRKEARGRQREKYLKKKQVEEDKHSAQNKAIRKRRYEAEGQGRVVKYRKYSDK